MTRYMTRQGDVLDAVCFNHYGRSDAVTSVLEANPGLSDIGPVLPSGILIELPELPAAVNSSKRIKLWD